MGRYVLLVVVHFTGRGKGPGGRRWEGEGSARYDGDARTKGVCRFGIWMFRVFC